MAPEEFPEQDQIALLQRRITTLERTLEASRILNSTLDLPTVLETLITIATESTNTEASCILLLDKNRQELRFVAATGSKREEVKTIRVPLKGSIAGTIVSSGRPLLIPDVSRDSRHFQQADATTGFITRSILGVPLQVKDRTIGVLEVLNKIGDLPFTTEDIEILTALAAQAAVAIENAQLMSDLWQAYQELQELDRLKSEFINITSHELRTPLAVILGYASLLEQEAPPHLKGQLASVRDSAWKLRGLIEDMVNLRHIDTGQIQLEPQRFEIGELIRQIAEEFSALAQSKEHSFLLDIPHQSVWVVADRPKIYLVLANLTSNAIKFTPPTGRLGITLEAGDKECLIAVWDTGPGIPLSEQERIFSRFYQIADSLTRRHEGLGLGLAVAKELVELHGGRIWVESQVNRGSTFYFTLPLQPEHMGA